MRLELVPDGIIWKVQADNQGKMEKQKGKNTISLGEQSAPPHLENLPRHAYFLADKGRYLNSESGLNPIPSGVLAALEGANG
jgi:hypothetical protein